MEEQIFKVIRILDSETILLNAGSNNDINVGDKFEIFNMGKDIKDPDTKKSLGTLDIIKETVSVDTVYEKMCICRHHIPNLTSNLAIGALSILENTNKTLNVDKTQMSNEMDEEHMIKLGDKARRIYINKSNNS